MDLKEFALIAAAGIVAISAVAAGVAYFGDKPIVSVVRKGLQG